MWQIIYSKDALKQLEKLDKATQQEIRETLANFHWYKMSRKLSGIRVTTNFWPVRVGAYSVLCMAGADGQSVDVLAITSEDRGL